MTDRERGFLDAVLADPSDDFPRLVYADWLEENGQAERSEFIRVQCEIPRLEAKNEANVMPARRSGEGWSAWENRHHNAVRERVVRLAELRRRERQLLREGHPRWCTLGQMLGRWAVPLIDHDPTSPGHARYRRGFVASVSLTLADFMKPGCAAAIFGAAPVEEVRLTDREPVRLFHHGTETWSWDARPDQRRPEDLPPALANLLPGGAGHIRYRTVRIYQSPHAAHAALSRAAVAFGRNLALPKKEAVSR